jgi:hypothetical protein
MRHHQTIGFAIAARPHVQQHPLLVVGLGADYCFCLSPAMHCHCCLCSQRHPYQRWLVVAFYFSADAVQFAFV